MRSGGAKSGISKKPSRLERSGRVWTAWRGKADERLHSGCTGDKTTGIARLTEWPVWAQAGEMKDSRDICDGESHGRNRVAWEDDLDGMTSSVDSQIRK